MAGEGAEDVVRVEGVVGRPVLHGQVAHQAVAGVVDFHRAGYRIHHDIADHAAQVLPGAVALQAGDEGAHRLFRQIRVKVEIIQKAEIQGLFRSIGEGGGVDVVLCHAGRGRCILRLRLAGLEPFVQLPGPVLLFLRDDGPGAHGRGRRRRRARGHVGLPGRRGVPPGLRRFLVDGFPSVLAAGLGLVPGVGTVVVVTENQE